MRVYRDDQKFINFRISAVMWSVAALFVFLAGSFWPPLQVATMMATVANGGTMYRPHLARYIEHTNPNGTVQRYKVATQVLKRLNLRSDVLQHVRNGLWDVVNEEGGTARRARVDACFPQHGVLR